MSETPETGPTRRPSDRTIAVLIIAAVAIVFVAENTDRTEIRFVVPEVTAPLWIALLGAVLVGAVGGYLAGRRH